MNLTSCYLTGFHYNLEQLQNFLVTKVTLDEEVAEEDLDEEVTDEDLDEEVADGDFEEDVVTLDLGNDVAEKEEDNDEDALQSLHLVLSSDENTVEECTLDELEEISMMRFLMIQIRRILRNTVKYQHLPSLMGRY